MSRYIDADKTIKKLAQSIKELRLILPASHFVQVKQDIEAFISFLRNQPTVDVRGNVKGEWIEDLCLERCNRCGERKEFPHWSFCPNCGADMRGDKE